MAILRLNDDALLVRPSSASPELTSRLTGAAIPLDDEQAIVVTLLSSGPAEIDELLERAAQHGVDWDWAALSAFIDVLERWGLLEIDHLGRPADPVDSYLEDDTPPDPPRIDDAAYEAQLEEEAPRTQIADMSVLLAQLRGSPAESGESAKTLELSTAAPPIGWDGQELEDRPLESGESARTLDLPPGTVPNEWPGAELEDRPTESGESARTIDLSPSRSQPPGALATEDARQNGRPVLRLVPPIGEEEPTGIAHKRKPAPPPQEPAAAGLPLHPRLIPRWMPKLLPHSRNILLVDPAAHTERELRSWEYQIARMLDGNRSPEQVADWSQSVGLQVHLNNIIAIIERLVAEGVLEPGITPLPPPQADPEPASAPPRRTPSAPPLEPQSSPFRDMGDSPDSIMESLDVIPVPGKRKASVPPRASAEPRAPAPMEPEPEEEDFSEALTRAAALVQERRRDEAEAVLRAILERNPGVVQALAMLDLIGGTQAARPVARRRLPMLWIGVGAGGLLLVIGLVLTLAISVEPTVTVPCRTELISLGKVTSHLAGRVTAIEVRAGTVVDKGQELARIADLERKRRITQLREQIADTNELLRIMRTSGTVADERKQKKLVAALTARLKREAARCKQGAHCEKETAKIQAQIESARRKLKFCEWQAEPDEITQVADQVAKMKQELAPLAGKPLEATVVSPRRSLVMSVGIAKGQKVSRGANLATFADADRFVVVARSGKEPLEGATPTKVRLVYKGSAQIYSPTKDAKPDRGTLRLELAAEVNRLPPDATCTLELSRGKMSLLRSWFR